MDKKSVKSFFDMYAETWDENSVKNEGVISKILALARITNGVSVLDVACGTGVLFDEYIKKSVSNLTAIDISSEMTRIAKEKYPQVEVICADAEVYEFSSNFDRIVIHNAFPHFVNERRLFENLTEHLKTGGRLTVAHSASREAIIACHAGKAENVSKELPTAENLASTMNEFLAVDEVISNSEMYLVSGVKRSEV